MSTDTFDQILSRLEHLEREKSDDLNKLKKIVLSSGKEETEGYLNELDLKKVHCVFKKLLKSDEKYISEDIGDIYDQILETLGPEGFYSKFESLIKDALTCDSMKFKSIHLKLLLNCLKSAKAQNSVVENGLLELVIDNMGDREEEISKRSVQILKYLSGVKG